MGRIVITGANRGIGFELAKQRASQHQVIALTREPSAALEQLGVRVIEGVDVTDQAAVDAAAKQVDEIDILINNAGLLKRTSLSDLDWDAMHAQMEVNAYGPLRVSAALAPKMKDGGKIAIITSRMGSIDDNSSGGSYGYRMSKCAVNMAGKSLSLDLADRAISVAILHPGFVKTDMTGGNGQVTPEQAAEMLWARIDDDLRPETSGTFWHANGDVLPW